LSCLCNANPRSVWISFSTLQHIGNGSGLQRVIRNYYD
jgi:hypothetical protein